MPLACPQCSQVNFDQSTSCIQCGFQLPPTDRTKRSFSRLPAINKVSLSDPSPPTPIPFPPQPQDEGFPPPQSSPFFPPPPIQEPVMQTAAMQEPVAPPLAAAPPSTEPGAMSSVPSLVAAAPPFAGLSPMPPASSLAHRLGSLRRAFAGYGKVITHHSWLLNDEQAQANDVRRTINEMLTRSGLDELQVVTEKLTDQSLVSEQREFTRIKRKLPTIFIYVTPAGSDLYISRATVVKPAISMIRTAIFIIVLAVMLCQFSSLVSTAIRTAAAAASPSLYGSPGASANPFFSAIGTLLGIVALLTCLDAPFVGLLISALIRSLVSWVFEKDPWVLLRSNSLNEFQRDDVALLEQVTDDIMRAAMKQLGLDANKIVAPAQGYQPPRRIRFI